MISDWNSLLTSRNFIHVGDERRSPASYARTVECAWLIFRVKTKDKGLRLETKA